MMLKTDTCVYLKWDRYAAMADFITDHEGTLEVPISFRLPYVASLAPAGGFPHRVRVSYVDWGATRSPKAE